MTQPLSSIRHKLTPCFIALAALVLGACGPSEPDIQGPPPDMRRLTEEQYRNIIADVFGSPITVGGRFDEPVRKSGLVTVGARNATVTSGSMRQFDEMARSIAAQVMAEPNLSFLVPCAKNSVGGYDATCAEEFISGTGRLLFRRPLDDNELHSRLAMVRDATDTLGDFKDGLELGLISLLVAPQFLFVSEDIEPSSKADGDYRLTGYSIASRLSFLLWNSAPDSLLLDSAEAGALHTRKGLETQVKRMMASPRLEAGVRAFFSDMLEFSAFDFLEKDNVIYPAFGVIAAEHAKEQTLLTIVDHVINEDADYRDLFVTRKTFMTRTLGQVYRVQVEAPRGVWQPFEFPANDPRVGIQSQLGFLALHSHPGRSSPTLRGAAIRSSLLCQRVPDPPPDVDFTEFNDPNSPSKTARQRLTAHSTSPACEGCHRITDPIGLALENFDGAGQFRTLENGEIIDTSGDLDGLSFEDGVGLGTALHANPALTTCLAYRLYAYASGVALSPRDPRMVYLEGRFADSGYRVKALMKVIATSDAFYAVSVPETAGTETAMMTIAPSQEF
jgi:hypothetical protein